MMRPQFINVDRLANPLFFLPLINKGILATAITVPVRFVSELILGNFEPAQLIAIVILVFPAWIAWGNIDVVSALGRRFTVRSLLLFGAGSLVVSLAAVPELMADIHRFGEKTLDPFAFSGAFLSAA